MPEFRMPSLGADMDAGTLVLWRVKPGDRVRRGDIVADVETQKGIIEVECFEEGIVADLLVQPNEKVPVGTVLAVLRTEGAPAAEPAAAVAAIGKPVVAPPAAVPPLTAVPRPVEKRVHVSPLARKLAEALGVDLHALAPGADGTIGRAEVERAAAAKKAAPVAPPAAAAVAPPPAPQVALPRPEAAETPPGQVKARAADFQHGMRQAIAAAMARSNREIPHYYLQKRIDLSRALRWLETENLKRSIKDRILPAVLLIKATAKALEAVPELNGFWLEERFQPSEAIHIGMAISLRQGGLIAPAIHHTDLKSLDELVEAVRDLITRTRANRLRSSELSDATITLTNLGDMGVETVFGVIYPPQVALVGFGKVMDQPWAENGMLGIRPVITATLSADHRASDGVRGAQFLIALDHQLQEPEKL